MHHKQYSEVNTLCQHKRRPWNPIN